MCPGPKATWKVSEPPHQRHIPSHIPSSLVLSRLLCLWFSGERRPVTADGGVHSNWGLGREPQRGAGRSPAKKFCIFWLKFYAEMIMSNRLTGGPPDTPRLTLVVIIMIPIQQQNAHRIHTATAQRNAIESNVTT